MKIHRFIRDFDLSQPELIITNTEVVHQIMNVLKLKKGEVLMVGDGKGTEAEGVLVDLSKKKVIVSLASAVKNKNELDIPLRLYCSILKREHFEVVVQKATELGVSEIIPILTERTVKLHLNQERMQRLLIEATEQSERGVVPSLSPIVSFKEALVESPQGQLFLFDRSGSSQKEFITTLDKKKQYSSVNLFIGPEGGWTDQELNFAQENGVTVVTLGKSILRAETAAIAALCFARLL